MVVRAHNVILNWPPPHSGGGKEMFTGGEWIFFPPSKPERVAIMFHMSQIFFFILTQIELAMTTNFMPIHHLDKINLFVIHYISSHVSFQIV